MDQDRETRIKHIISKGHKRNDVFQVIPDGASRILDVGFGDGALLLRLGKDKGCTELYGVEVGAGAKKRMAGLLDGCWEMYLGEGDNHLEPCFHGFFNWIILHDVLEHMYDPWKFLAYVTRYASPDCRLILVCPNAQYWETIFSLLHGDFPYGLDGHFNEEHIRWFTPKSMIEMAVLSGLAVEECHLLLTSRISRELAGFIEKNRDGRLLPMPPVGFNHREFLNFFPPNFSDLRGGAGVEVVFRTDKRDLYPHFLAVKVMLVCSVAECLEQGAMHVGQLKKRRQEYLENRSEELASRMPKAWKAYVWQPG